MTDSGYAITSRCLTRAECDEIYAAILRGPSQRTRAGIRHLMSNPDVAALAKSDQFLALAKGWLGETAVPFRATLFEKSSTSNWLTGVAEIPRHSLAGHDTWAASLGCSRVSGGLVFVLLCSEPGDHAHILERRHITRDRMVRHQLTQ